MDNLNASIRALRSKDNIEANLKEYLKCSEERIMNYALVNLALHCVSLAEASLEGFSGNEDITEEAGLLALLGEGSCPDTEKIRAARDKNTARMQRLTDDVDIYAVNEYVLNRLEHRFRGDQDPGDDYTDQGMTDELLRFLASKKDEAQNLYTVRLIEQLPVRMTRNRFLEIIAERLTVYRDNDQASFDEIMMLLRSAACLKEADNEELRSLSQALSSLKDADTDEKVYTAAFNSLTEISVSLNGKIDFFQLLQEVLNDLLAVSLTGQYINSVKQKDICLNIVREAAEVLLKTRDSLSMEAINGCGKLEGLPEENIFLFREAQGFRNELMQRYLMNIRSHGFKKDFEVLRQAELLLSGSYFADLEEKENDDLSPEYFNRTVAEFLQAMNEKLSGVSRRYMRSLMARVFTVLPPHFDTQEALETYIYDSLRSCNDIAEKTGCVELLHQIMAE